MSEHRAIQARYADWRPVKGRKVLQITLEVPLEQQEHVLSMLGAPLPDRDLWVAVALLREERGEMKGGKLAQQAGILCNEGAFNAWAQEQGHEDGKAFIYGRCGVTSRVMLDHDEDAATEFRGLRLDYDLWLRGVAA